MTTPYIISLAPTAQRQIRELALKNRKIIMKLIEALAINPRPPGVKKIDGMTGLYCDEINGLRLIYKIEEHAILILLVKS